MNRERCRSLAIVALCVLGSFPAHSAEVRKLTLTDAVHLAIAQNHALRIARLKVVENEQKKAGERSSYFPSITEHAKADYNTGVEHIGIPAGTLGIVGGSLVPAQNVNLPQGKKSLLLNQATVSQPLTQLIRIHEANRIAAAETAISRDELKKAEIQVALDVHNVYFGILIAQLQKQAAQQQSTFAGAQLRESQEDVLNGNTLRLASMEARASQLEGQQAILTADLRISDLTTELNNLMGLPLDTRLELDPAVVVNPEPPPQQEYVQTAFTENPAIASAQESVKKAKAAVAAAKSAYIPDAGAYVSNTWQDGIAFIVRDFTTVGAQVNWDVFDFGRRRAAVRERHAQLAQAEENLRRLKDDVATQVERCYHKLEQTKSMLAVADQVLALRRESERVTQNQLVAGVVTISDRHHASAATYKSQADYLQAKLTYLLAWAELQQVVGRTPGL